ncbi:uncharacterized protein PAC_20026 [Phialocephala subalpina]|uniref:FAD-binding PCMH-type domain-containing protein n=1 Tax=Phialocephala subalpina TaxID=576137 RepID=A0A1L7XYU6_9HELO|nr:uncharacterized protein PAC_20026 [Phialocephala subalpina]
MHFCQMLFAGLILSAAFVSASPSYINATQEACHLLSKIYPDSTFFPGTTRYEYENTVSWTATAWLGPSCVFCPFNSHMTSAAVQLFSAKQVPFAIRSGGAMPVSNAANIGPEGILISSTNFTTLRISDDLHTVSVGSGIRFPVLYGFLENYGVSMNGIRIGDVGVIGFLLGGGIGFFSYEYGMASTYVLAFEVRFAALSVPPSPIFRSKSHKCVLANGTIVTASENSHADLFWALRGGGNNFCIVTRADLKTIPVASVYLGNVGYGSGSDVQEQYLQSMVDFSLYAGSDPQSAVEGQIRWNPTQSPDITYWAFLFHSGNDISPPGLQNLTAPVLPITLGNITRQTMKEWSDSFPYSSDLGLREFFYFFAVPADAEAFRIAMDTYFSIATVELKDVEDFFTAFSVMPITEHAIAVSSVNGGNPLGLTEDSVPAVWLVESPAWGNAADDETVVAVHSKINTQIAENLKAAGFEEAPFVYLSDAEKGQKVFEGYGEESWERLREIRARYDPGMVFQKLVPGGVKVEGDIWN